MAPYSPPNAHYAHINLPSDLDTPQMKWLIGEHGVNLYDWTQKSNLKYLWMDFKNKRLELWGNYNAFEYGAKELVDNFLNDKLKFIESDEQFHSVTE